MLNHPQHSNGEMLTIALSQKDLAQLLGSHSGASEILSGKREPSKTAIKKITKNWEIPADCLISYDDKVA